MDRRNWPWRKMMNRNSRLIMSSNAASDANTAIAASPGNSSRSLEPGTSDRAIPAPETSSAENPSRLEKRRHTSLLGNAEAYEALASRKDAELQAKALADKLEDAEKDLVSKEAMVKQHGKVAEEAVSGWEKSEAEALSLKQELAVLVQQKSLLDRRIAELEENSKSSTMRAAELEEALRSSRKQLRQTQEDHHQKTQEAIDKKAQDWDRMKGEMEEIEQHLRQCMLAAEARSCAMAKSLEERARAVTESQEAKARAEMEAGLLQVKLESQATEMAAVRYELHALTKELDIRNRENEHGKKAVDAAHKRHLEDAKKITRLDAECQRLRNLVKKRISGPAAIAHMRIEADKNDQNRRRSSVSSGLPVSSRNTKTSPDLTDKLHAVEEEANILRETLVKRSAELDTARLISAQTTYKLSAAEEQLDSLQGTPKSARSTQSSAFECLLRSSQAIANSDRLDDEVSCAESWASALISELAQLKKLPNHPADDFTVDLTFKHLVETPKKSLASSGSKVRRPDTTAHSSPSQQDLSVLRTFAGKNAQLQAANLMCKNAMTIVAAAEAKLGGTWMSENPRSTVSESVNSVSEAHGIILKLDRILDDICIAVASVDDATNDNPSVNGFLPPCKSATEADAAVCCPSNSSQEQIEKQAKTIDELRMQMSMLETTQTELQLQLQGKEDELKQVRSELVDASNQIEKLKASELCLQSLQEKLIAEEELKRGEMQALIETKENEMTKLQNDVISLGVELSELRKKHNAAIAKCEELEKKLQSYVDTECSIATSCKLNEDLALRAKKEREVATAKERLAECQRTILVLGKQLSEFTPPTSAHFDSNMSLQHGISDANHHLGNDHALKLHARSHQRKLLAYSSVTPHDDGTDLTATYPNSRTSDLAMRQHLTNGVNHSKPRRINSDLSYRTGSKNPVVAMFSVAEHLQMDDGLSSLYDSRTESAGSSPSSQHTSPSDTIQMDRSQYVDRNGSGARSSLAKSLECAAVPTTGDGNGHTDERKSQSSIVPGTKKGGRKGSKGLSRFFGRSKK